MASTKTFIFAGQKGYFGSISLTLVSHFDSGSGNTNYNYSGKIMSMSPLKSKIPANGFISELDNVSLKLSDFDDIFADVIGSKATQIEGKLYLDGDLIFLGYVDLQSFARNVAEYTVDFTLVSALSELKNQSIEDDLEPLLTDYTYFSETCVNLKQIIEKILSLVGFATTDINYDVDITFQDQDQKSYTYDEVYLRKSYYFGTDKIHNMTNCYDFLAHFAYSLLTSVTVIGDEVYIYDFQKENSSTLDKIKSVEINDFSQDAIDGLIVQYPDSYDLDREEKGDYEYGRLKQEFTATFPIHYLVWDWNVVGDDGVATEMKLYAASYGSYTLNSIIYVIANAWWDFFSSLSRTRIEIECVDRHNVFDTVPYDSTDYQLYETEVDYVTGHCKYIGRAV